MLLRLKLLEKILTGILNPKKLKRFGVMCTQLIHSLLGLLPYLNRKILIYRLSLESYAYNAGDSLEYVYDLRTYEITVLAWEYQGKVIGKTRQIKGDDGYKYDSVAYNHTYNGPPPAYFHIWVGCCMPCDKSNPSSPPAKPLGKVLKFLETGFAKTGEILTSSWIIWLIGLLAVLLVLLLVYKWWREHKDRRAAVEMASVAEMPPTSSLAVKCHPKITQTA